MFRNLYQSALIGRLILTWFPNPPMAIVGPLRLEPFPLKLFMFAVGC